MAESADHVSVWKKNAGRAESWKTRFPDDPDWTLVFQFYAGVHLTDAYLATKPERFRQYSDHAGRENAIRRATELKTQFRSAYNQLKALSENVRYQPTYVVRKEDLEAGTKALQTVESFLRGKLKKAGVSV